MAVAVLTKEILKHSLFSRKSSALVRVISWLCILGVGVSVTALIVVLSVMNGFDDAIRRRLISVQPHLIVQSSLTDLEKIRGTVERMEPAAVVSPYQLQDVLLRTSDGYFGGAEAKGLTGPTIKNLIVQSRRLKNEELRNRYENFELPEAADVELKGNEVLVGIDLARSLEVYEGDEIVAISPESLLLPSGSLPPYERLTIKGIVRTNVPEVDASSLFYLIGSGMKRMPKSSQSGVEIYLPDPYDHSELKAALGSTFKVESWDERNKALFYSLKMEKVAMGLFLGLSVLIASFSILTVLLLLVTHKRTEIGILMSMGLSRWKTRLTFTSVGMLLSSIGVLGGVFFGLLLCVLLDTFPLIPLPDIYYDSRIPVLVDTKVVLCLLGVSATIAFFSAWVPARFATRENPSELLRFQTTDSGKV